MYRTHKLDRRDSYLVNGAKWLAAANLQPQKVFEKWQVGQLAGIETGYLFNVVRVTNERVGLVALRDLQQADVHVGPVLHDRARARLEFLVTTRAAGQWQISDTELLSRQNDGLTPTTVAMPAPGLRTFAGKGWIVLPDGVRGPTDPGELAVALRRARERLRLLES
ncbi:hypothetical protein ABT263_28235 [Kitasatospora sp. NPDC001603]|uniref:hypothetical protein n=1 Tax=Kitasatospora sp. NPDC001603 TaxID=3154388 RepID=UPI0033348688